MNGILTCGKRGLTPVLMKKISDIFRLATVVLTATLLLPATEVQAYPATQCAASRFGSDLNCTANDVSITGMSVVSDLTSCAGGTNITLDLQMTVNFGSANRYDIGIFISNDGKSPQYLAPTGAATCAVSALPVASPFQNLNANGCGDGGGTLSGIHYMPNVTVPCQSLAGAGGNLYIPFVVSWNHQSSGTCGSSLDVVPAGNAKCNSPTIAQGSVAVVVLPAITKTDNKTTLFTGDSTSYIVTVTNTTGALLSGVVFKDPAVTGIAANSVSCAAAGGATCPASSTVAAMQGAGITIPDMPAGGSVNFTVGATLTGNPGDTRTNTASVTVGGQINSASDTDTIVDTIAILPTTQAKTGDKGAMVSYTYTLYNFDTSADAITLAAVSSKGWTIGVSPTPVTVAAGGSATVTVTVTIPGGATIGDVDSTTITATSGNNPGKSATATAVTTVTTVLTLTPSNTGSGGAGSSVYYAHRVQNNASASKTVSLTPVLSGSCTGWTSALFESDKTTPLTSPVTLSASGGYKDFTLKISIPAGAAAASTCTATLTAAYTSGAPNAVSVTDVTTVKNLVLYKDPGYTTESYVYPAGNNVYANGYGLTSGTSYEYRWYDSNGTEACAPRAASTTGTTFPDTCLIPAAGPLGTWIVQIWNNTTNTLFVQSNFYVGPDHLKADYSGADPAINTNAIIDLALHDKANHVVPFDPLGNLVKGNPADPEGPLMITVTVSGSATIVSTTLTNAVITGQSVTGKLSDTTGTATLTISDSVAETVTITPVSYKGLLYGSPVRDESATITFTGAGLHHYELSLPSSGISCLSSSATVTACADATSPCTNPYTAASGTTATLATSAGALGSTTVTFNAAGVATTTLSYPAAADGATATVTLSGEQLAAVNPRQCCPDGASCVVANSCSTTFNTAGFIFSGAADGAAATIPVQVAGTTSSTYYLRAVKTSTTTKACESALSGPNTVNFAYECNNPTTCYGANLMSVNGGAATTIARNDNGSVSSYTPVSMTFDANGNAPFTFNYSDVGLVTLHTAKAAGGSLLSALAGSSNAFVVKPFEFVLSNIQQTAAPNLVNPAAANAAGAKFVKAGEDFSATVTAVTAASTATPNYGKETVPEGVTLTRALVAPAAGANPALGNPAVFGAFSDGVATGTTFNWGEVGIITLTPSVADGNYLGAGDTTGTTSANVGRFYPDHFDTAVDATATTPMPCPSGLTCPILYNGFIYSGQPFSVQVSARNLAGGTTTNYDAALGFSKAVTLTAWDALGSTTTQNPPGTGVLANGSVAAATFSAGAATTATPTYTFATSPTAPTDIYMRAVDTDTASSLRAIPASSVEGGVKVVSGRVKISNAHGSELLSLPMTATVQYWDNPNWVTSTTDIVTSFDTTTNIVASIVKGPLASVSVAGAGVVTVDGGVITFTLNKPLVTGSADISLNAPACLLAGSNVAGVNPSKAGRATFGVYKGANEFIYLRENY